MFADLIHCDVFWSDMILSGLYLIALYFVVRLTWKLSRQIPICGPQRKPQKIFLLLVFLQSVSKFLDFLNLLVRLANLGNLSAS
jgi:hypothetical protein